MNNSIDHLAAQRTSLLSELEETFPQHNTTISALHQQFEAHIGFLRINLESYTALQLSIISALHKSPTDLIQATAVLLP